MALNNRQLVAIENNQEKTGWKLTFVSNQKTAFTDNIHYQYVKGHKLFRK